MTPISFQKTNIWLTWASLLLTIAFVSASTASAQEPEPAVKLYLPMLFKNGNPASVIQDPVGPQPQLTPSQQDGRAINPAATGEWSAPVPWPITAIHASLMPDGRILTWDSNEDDFLNDGIDQHLSPNKTTRADMYDPIANTHSPVWADTGSDLFCSGHAHLPTGDLFISGGTTGHNFQINKTNIFSYVDDSWTLGPQMHAARWYPSVTPLANGDMLMTGGRAAKPEVYDFQNNSIRELSNVSGTSSFWPWLRMAPNGKVFYAGPSTNIYNLDVTRLGTKTSLGTRQGGTRNDGSYAIYDIGKVLVSGGSAAGISKNSATILDMNSGASSATGSMNTGRHHHNLTILADGTVLATGGNTDGSDFCSLGNSGYTAELWDPATGDWTEMDTQQITRQYHSTALLLPDARVISTGEGRAFFNCTQQYNAEFYSPPYLFNPDGSLATRPVINTIPKSIDYQDVFTIQSNQADDIDKIHLIRLGSVTHSNDQGQRLVPLSFSQSGNNLNTTAPANANIAPPGHYMVFLINDNGVPSVAEIVLLGWPSIT
ncbi:MAG: galactose oxidase-like domain-containing protein, partial [Chloroflexota bacterium]